MLVILYFKFHKRNTRILVSEATILESHHEDTDLMSYRF